MKLACPACGRAVPGVDIDLGRGVGVCRPCGEVVPLPGAALATVDAPARPVALFRPTDLRWNEIAVGDTTRVAVRARRSAAFFMVPFLVFWWGFLGFWYANAIRRGDVVALLFPILHVGAGLFVAWSTARVLFNTTVVRVGLRRFDIREGPVPVWRGTTSLPLDDVRGFGVEESRTRNTTTYKLVVHTGEGEALPLSLSFEDASHGEYARARLDELVDEARTRARVLGSAPYRG